MHKKEMHKSHSSRHGHHMEHPAHKKHHGHKEAHKHHEHERHKMMEHQLSRGRNAHMEVHAEGRDYAKPMEKNDDRMRGIEAKVVPHEEKEVGAGGKMHFSEHHKNQWLRGGSLTPRRG